MALRVVVFLDWQNVYRRGRAAFFGEHDHHTLGQVDPLKLGKHLARQVHDGEFRQVRIYRGIPTNENDPKGYAANRRQTAAWMKGDRSRTHVYLRPLQYLPGMPPREKGIDVQLAIDFVVMAVRDEYDVGILFSTDTDLKPALDAVHDHGATRAGDPRAEVAAWTAPNARGRRIAGSGSRQIGCHWLDGACMLAVGDQTDYSL